MPLDFGFSFISFNKSRVDAATAVKLSEKSKFTYWELTDLIKSQFEGDSSGARVIDFQNGAEQAFKNLFRADFEKYVDLENRKVNFTDGSFAKMLKDINEQRVNGYFRPEFSSTDERTADFIDSQRLYYYKYQIDMVLKDIFQPTEDKPPQEAFPIPDVGEIVGLLVNERGEAEFKCYQAYGINSNSRNKTLAWEFIKFMLGEEMQQSLNLLGFPVNNAAFVEDSKIYFTKFPNYKPVNENEPEGEYTADGFFESNEEKSRAAYQKYYECLSQFVDCLGLYYTTDRIISEMVNSETARFFDGLCSAEEAAEALQNSVKLYLDE
jgi:multiple sugar transport system substrate-binding protein